MADISVDFAEKVLALAEQVTEQAEVYLVEGTSTPVSFEANRLKLLQAKEERGLALRVVANGRVGLASATRLDDAQAVVDDAVAVARFGAEARFELPSECPSEGVAIYDPVVAELTMDEIVELGEGMIDSVLSFNPDILCEVHIYKGVGTTTILNSRGGRASYRRTSFSASLAANLIRGTDMLDVYEGSASDRRADVDTEGVVERTLKWVRLAESTTNVRTGQMPVIFTPKATASTLVISLAAAFNGKMVWQGVSPLRDRLGEQAFDRRLSLYDDGRIDYALPSAPCDDEGMPTRRTPLAEEGVVTNFLYDLQTAGLAGAASTGNASRGLGSLPNPAPHALVFAPGDTSYRDMLAGIEEGLLVDQTMGAWAGNVLAGEFSGNVHLGYKIERGELVGRVKDTMVAGNVFEALADLVAIGDEVEWVNGSLRVPYLCFRSLGVASKS